MLVQCTRVNRYQWTKSPVVVCAQLRHSRDRDQTVPTREKPARAQTKSQATGCTVERPPRFPSHGFLEAGASPSDLRILHTASAALLTAVTTGKRGK